MTRKTQNRILTVVVVGLTLLIGLALAAKLSGIPWALNFYEFIRDTSLLIVTVIAAYMAHIYQMRASFLQSLREQWHDIVRTKAELIYYCHMEKPELEDYLIAARELSECIDTMRIVYANVGETDKLIGLYPYSPLHHMRIVLESLDPRKGAPTAEQRFAARGEIWDAFNAIREHFLDEFDIEEPTRPIVIHQMKRKRRDGASPDALKLAKKQLAAQQNQDR
ncbi:MAG: hypothetical protein WBP94_07370 [Rhodomicrobiaceae bacterium]